jgi:hypothetical protein
VVALIGCVVGGWLNIIIIIIYRECYGVIKSSNALVLNLCIFYILHGLNIHLLQLEPPFFAKRSIMHILVHFIYRVALSAFHRNQSINDMAKYLHVP